MNTLAIQLIKTYLPYLLAFLLGVILAWKGCGGVKGEKETVYVEKPIPTIEYVDRWKTDTVRFVKTVVKQDTVRETVSNNILKYVVDTVLVVDTVRIVDTWLSEVAKYDTTVTQKNTIISLKWQNYQNRTENMIIDYTPPKERGKFSLGIHGNAGLMSDFNTSYVPLMGLGVQATVKKTYFSVDYGFNGQHYVGFRVGRNIVNL